MDILKRIDHAQQFCKFYADGLYSVETEKWKHHVTPKFIEDIRQYIESLQLKLMHVQTQQQAEPVAQVHPNHLKQSADGNPWCREVLLYSGNHEGDLLNGENYRVKLYTAPPQRKELSASEILDMMPSAIPAEYDGPLMEFARAIEAKLKERNGY